MQNSTKRTGWLRNKIALVTGAASGIGRATALLLAREGVRVAVTDIDQSGARQVEEVIVGNGGEATWKQLDVRSENDWEQALSMSHWRPVDVLLANAGISFAKPVTEIGSGQAIRRRLILHSSSSPTSISIRSNAVLKVLP